MQIKSRYKPLQIIVILFGSVAFLTIAYVLYAKREPYDSFLKAYATSIYLTVFTIWLLITFFQRSPRIIFDDEFITIKYLFSTQTEDWLSVTEIYLSMKEGYTMFFIMTQMLEATTIHFSNGEALILWEDMYGNLPEIREFISKKAKEKIKDPKSQIISRNIPLIDKKKYAGNPWTTFNTLMLIGWVVFFFFFFDK